MNVFLSHAVTAQDAPLAARLRAVAASYGMQILLPDRTGTPRSVIADLRRKLAQADVVLVLITNNVFDLSAVNREVEAAQQAGKPILALVENKAMIHGWPDHQIVQFDRYNPVSHEQALMAALQQMRTQSQTDWTALGWLAAIAMGFIALSSFTDEKPNK